MVSKNAIPTVSIQEKMELGQSGQVFKLTGDKFNYLWKYQMRIALEGRETFEVVDGTKTLSNAMDIAAWKKKNNLAKMLISMTLDTDHLEMTITCGTAKEMWDRLTAIHEQYSAESINLLTLQFFEYKYQNGDSIGKHISKIEAMAKRLEDIRQKFSEEQVISKILSGLPSVFRHKLTGWKSMPDAQKTRKTLIMRILEEENMIKIARSAYGSSGSDNAFYTGINLTSTIRRRSGPEPDYIKEIKAWTRCHHCNKLGHWKRECPNLPKEMKSIKTESFAHLTQSKRESITLTAIIEELAQSLASENIAPA